MLTMQKGRQASAAQEVKPPRTSKVIEVRLGKSFGKRSFGKNSFGASNKTWLQFSEPIPKPDFGSTLITVAEYLLCAFIYT